ncbi:patatin-like phospholipase domain-containing protein [bacterium]|nr:patatin-like phospholipase domain-containing protein [bacterium]
MPDQKFQAIQRSQIGIGLTDVQIELVSKSVEWAEYNSGDIIFHQGDPGDSMFLVAEGRVKITVAHTVEDEKFVDYLSVGEHFGEMAILTGRERAVTMMAVMDSRLLELHRPEFQTLIERIPVLAVNVSRALGLRLRRETVGKKIRNVSRVIGIAAAAKDANDDRMTVSLVNKLAVALDEQEICIRVIADHIGAISKANCLVVLEIPPEMDGQSKADWVHSQLATQCTSDLTLVCLSDSKQEDLGRILVQCEQVFWLSGPANADETKSKFQTLLKSESRLADKIQWGWLLPDGFNLENLPAPPDKINPLDLKIVLGESSQPSRHEQMSISRLVRVMRKTRLGLALGGGAARGMAHLGVLKAFEQEGIFFDHIAGTSAGALIAVPYAYGYTPEQCTELFRTDLRPGWLFRHFPKGNDWYMVFQFRTGKWDGLLRRRVGKVKLEQLLTPVSTVAADLITGRQVVRDTGDAIHAILESINLPNIAKPIMRDGMALVDGGIVNNIPSDILPERGADLVVGVDISTKIALRFGNNTPEMIPERMRAPSQWQTIMRANEVQDFQITALRTKEVDQMIVVDTSMFDYTDFRSAREMSVAGEEAVALAMPQFKQLLQEQKESESVTTDPCWLPK